MEKAREEQAMRRCPLFAGLDAAQTAEALHFFEAVRKDYRRGDVLFAGGSPLTRFGLVLDGLVHVSTFGLNGEELLMAAVEPGGTFGESLCFLRTKDPPVWIRAASDCAVLWLSAEPVRTSDASDAAREAANRFITMLAQRTLHMNDRIQILSRGTLREKLTTFFSEYRNLTGSATFTVPFDRSGMARYLACDRAALSRELSRMRQEGILDYYRSTFRLLK